MEGFFIALRQKYPVHSFVNSIFGDFFMFGISQNQLTTSTLLTCRTSFFSRPFGLISIVCSDFYFQNGRTGLYGISLSVVEISEDTVCSMNIVSFMRYG